jgi:hypothetical protein
MQCEEFEDRINAVLDQRERPEWDAELRLHFESCADCRDLATAYGAVLDGYYTACATRSPADLTSQVLAQMTAQTTPAKMAPAKMTAAKMTAAKMTAVETLDPALATHVASTASTAVFRRRALRAAVAVASLATAAGLLIAFLPQAPVRQPSGAGPQAAPLQQPSLVATAEPAASPDPLAADPAARIETIKRAPLLPLLFPKLARRDKSTDPYASMVKQTGKGLAGLLLQVPGFGGRRGIIDASDNAENEPAWAVQLSEGLRPVTDSVTKSLTILLEAFSVTDSAKRS